MRAFICLVIVCIGVIGFMYREEARALVMGDCDYSCEVWKDIDEIIIDMNIFTQ